MLLINFSGLSLLAIAMLTTGLCQQTFAYSLVTCTTCPVPVCTNIVFILSPLKCRKILQLCLVSCIPSSCLSPIFIINLHINNVPKLIIRAKLLSLVSIKIHVYSLRTRLSFFIAASSQNCAGNTFSISHAFKISSRFFR